MAHVLVCDDEQGIREMLSVLMRRSGHECVLAASVGEARKALATRTFDIVLTDLMLPDGSGLDVLYAARESDSNTQVIVITAYASTEQAVEAMRLGAYDFVEKPFKNPALLATVEKALEKRAIVDANRALRAEIGTSFQLGDVIGKSPAMRRVMEMIERVASARASVLVTGESGCGKEMVARALHQVGDRAKQPLVVVHCGAIPEALMESELFGHEKGSFTGATAKTEGLFRAADKGTIFLDEIGELTPTLQVKLLRVLQEKKIRSVGGEKEIELDVRVIAATNRIVEKEVAAGRFREDLFYRLNVIRIEIPPLRDRPEDIPLLAERFVAKHASLQGKRLDLAPEAVRWLTTRQYPGNVRELENVIERAVTLAVGTRIGLDDLPRDEDGGGARAAAPSIAIPPTGLDLDAELARLEREVCVAALERTGGVRTEAARLLGMTFRSFRYRLAKHGLASPDSTEEPMEGDTDPGRRRS